LFKSNRKSAIFPDNELYYTGKSDGKKRVVLTINEIQEILHHHHSNPVGGHSDVNATLQKISSHYYWNGMKEDIQEYVSQFYNMAVNLLPNTAA
jgi:hypothetical protein